MDNDSLEVSSEFIDENKNLVKPMQKSSAPYSKQKRFLRREEVHRLHFELGYTAIKISDMMKINRNTINSDVKYWYSKLTDRFNERSFYAELEKHQLRLELQRTRLVEELDKHKNELEERLSIERLILEIDSRINGMLFKAVNSIPIMTTHAVNMANKALEKSKQTRMYYSESEFIGISKVKRDAVNKILSGKYTLVETKKDALDESTKTTKEEIENFIC